MIDKFISKIQLLWDDCFVEHMDDKAKIDFPKILKKLEMLYNEGDFEEVERIANENYRWAFFNADFEAELSPIGWNYRTMANYFRDLKNYVEDMHGKNN